jgi:hypothetical protein
MDFSLIDPQRQESVLAFDAKVVPKYQVSEALLLGS